MVANFKVNPLRCRPVLYCTCCKCFKYSIDKKKFVDVSVQSRFAQLEHSLAMGELFSAE